MSGAAFLFPGQGSQAVGMGKDFFNRYSQAREIFARADEVLGFSLSQICFEGPEERLRLTEITQPAILVVSYIAYTLMGIEPLIAAGHSLGEYSALVAAGALSIDDALILVHNRGKYMQEAVPVGNGAMAAVLDVSYEEVEKALAEIREGVVEIANWNSQEQIVIAGHKEAVNQALELIKSSRSILLPVSAPFHCELMKEAERRLSSDLDRVSFGDLRFPIVTNVDAEIIHHGREARDALKRQVSRTVLWYKSMEKLTQKKISFYVELGPGRVLSGLAKRIARSFSSQFTLLNVEDSDTLERTRAALSGVL
ncbi:MAG: ACP S-malonyltransferase [Candidatus Aminicenantaceae bacterium]